MRWCSNLSFIAGPFKINGVPLRRVNQAYVIGTSTKVDISGVNLEKFDDKYFGKAVEKKKKKGEGEFFEAEKEVSLINSIFIISLTQFIILLYYYYLKIVNCRCHHCV